MEKKFSLESTRNREGVDYHVSILKIINDIEESVRFVSPDPLFNKETHEKKIFNSHTEILGFEKVRRDICESFGIPLDPDHIYIYGSTPFPVAKEQRALRAFYVMIDAINKQGFYGEGRTDHNTLLNKLIELAKQKDPSMDFDSAVEKINAEPPQIIIFKGFLSIKEFQELSDSARKFLESPLYTPNGVKIETSTSWFLTGHNLDGVPPSAPNN